MNRRFKSIVMESILIGIILLSVAASFSMAFHAANLSSSALDYDTEENDRSIAASSYYHVSWSLDSGDEIEGFLQTSSTSETVDFFICNDTNFAAFGSENPYVAYEEMVDVHVGYINWTCPSTETWYFVYNNSDPSDSVTLDLCLARNSHEIPSFSGSYDKVVNNQTIETGEYYTIPTDSLSAGDEIAGRITSLFQTDSFDYYLLDDDNYNRFQNDEAFFEEVKKEGTTDAEIGQYSSKYKVSQDGFYYIVVSAKDAADTITVSMYGNWYTPEAEPTLADRIMDLLPIVIPAAVAVVVIAVILVKRKNRTPDGDVPEKSKEEIVSPKQEADADADSKNKENADSGNMEDKDSEKKEDVNPGNEEGEKEQDGTEHIGTKEEKTEEKIDENNEESPSP